MRFDVVRAWAFLLVTALILPACGGGSPGGGASHPAESVGASEGPGGPIGTGGDDGPYYAIVTIGDVRFEFDMDAGNNRCGRPVVGVFTGGGYTDDANPSGSISEERTSGARLQFTLESDDPDGSQIVVEDFATAVEWWSGQGGPQGTDEAVVEGWTATGITATGTASFIDTEASRLAGLEGGTIDPVAGSFEIHCAGR